MTLRIDKLKISNLLRAYAYHYGAALIASSVPGFHNQCGKKARSAMINFFYEGEHLKYPVKWKELHLKPFFLKEGSDLKEHMSEIKWREYDPLVKIVKNSFGNQLVVKKGRFHSARIDQTIREPG